MGAIYPRCAGLDVHKDTVVASARLASGRDVSVEVRTFATTTAGLLALSGRLAERGCTHAAMEATGIYWKPARHAALAQRLLPHGPGDRGSGGRRGCHGYPGADGPWGAECGGLHSGRRGAAADCAATQPCQSGAAGPATTPATRQEPRCGS